MSNRGIASRPATLLGRCVPRDQEHWSGAGHDLTTGTNMLGIGSETSSTATTALNLMPSSRATARLTTFTRIFLQRHRDNPVDRSGVGFNRENY